MAEGKEQSSIRVALASVAAAPEDQIELVSAARAREERSREPLLAGAAGPAGFEPVEASRPDLFLLFLLSRL